MRSVVSRLPAPDDLAAAARLAARLPTFLRRPVGPDEARAALRGRLERRVPTFLALVREAVFERRIGPYADLFGHLGCEAGDFEALVRAEGVEGALSALLARGLYLSVEELKGRREIVRGSVRLRTRPGDLRTGRVAAHLVRTSSGSRGRETIVGLDLRTIRQAAENKGLVFGARGALGWRHALWGVPGGTGLTQVLQYAGFGCPPRRWFWQVDAAAAGLHPRYRRSARFVRALSLLAGVPLPAPEYVPIDRPEPIARWMAETLRRGETPHLYTFTSPAVRLCQAAQAAGLDLGGAEISLGGEPLTAARLATIRAAGARAVPSYGTAESGGISYGCLAPDGPDDLHLFHDRFALTAGPGPTGRPGALFVTSLSPLAPLLLLNVSTGDRADLADRACGCPLERLGWTRHLANIRSFEKLTAGGMTFLDADVARALEETLPARFGGGPTDYQLVEQEAEDGRPRLRLVVHPRVGPLDEPALLDAFLGALGGGDGVERVMELQWRAGGWLGVERRPPAATPSGKILHLHVERPVATRAGA